MRSDAQGRDREVATVVTGYPVARLLCCIAVILVLKQSTSAWADDEPAPAPAAKAESPAATTKPAEPTPAASSSPEQPAEKSGGQISMNFVTDDAAALLVLRPQGFFGINEFKILDRYLNQQGDYRNPVPVTQLEQVTMVKLRSNTERPAPDPQGISLIFDINIFRTTKPIDWGEKRKSMDFEMRPAEHAGKQYFTLPGQPNMCFWPADERHYIVGDEWTIKRVIDQSPGDVAKLAWAGIWERAADSSLLVAFEPTWAISTIKQQVENQPDLRLPASMLEGLLKDSRAFLCAVDANDSIRARMLLSCPTEQLAKEKTQAFKSLVGFTRQLSKPKPAGKAPAAPPPVSVPGAALSRSEVTEKLFSTAQFEQLGTDSVLTMKADIPLGNAFETITATVGGLLGPNMASAAVSFRPRPASATVSTGIPSGVMNSPAMVKRRGLSRKNLEEVAAALQKYQARTNALPARVSVSPEGKPLLSWRVLILPDLGYDELYQQFHLDEPWDSEHNRPLSEKMPRQFGGAIDADATPTSSSTAVVALVGPQSVWEQSGSQLADGPNQTVLIVESRGGDTWTKPADVAVNSSGQPERRLGGLHPNGVLLATADGHVHFIFDRDLTALLPALLTIAGGETVDMSKLRQD